MKLKFYVSDLERLFRNYALCCQLHITVSNWVFLLPSVECFQCSYFVFKWHFMFPIHVSKLHISGVHWTHSLETSIQFRNMDSIFETWFWYWKQKLDIWNIWCCFQTRIMFSISFLWFQYPDYVSNIQLRFPKVIFRVCFQQMEL